MIEQNEIKLPIIDQDGYAWKKFVYPPMTWTKHQSSQWRAQSYWTAAQALTWITYGNPIPIEYWSDKIFDETEAAQRQLGELVRPDEGSFGEKLKGRLHRMGSQRALIRVTPHGQVLTEVPGKPGFAENRTEHTQLDFPSELIRKAFPRILPNVEEWMLKTAQAYMNEKKSKPYHKKLIPECIKYFKDQGIRVTHRAAKDAYAKLPPEMKRRPGEH